MKKERTPKSPETDERATPETPESKTPETPAGTPKKVPMGAAQVGAAALKGKLALKIVSIGVAVALFFFLLVYGAGALIETGGFSISFDKAASAVQISLSETADFASPTVRLNVPPAKDMTNIGGEVIPADVDGAGDGSHGTANYIAYTFYVRNEGAACALAEVFEIESSVRHADEAIRVTVYRDGEAATYAKIGTDGLPEPNTTPFYGKTVFEQTSDFSQDGVRRYTVVIWLEGNDPECLDDIKGGNVKMSYTFTAGEAES